MSWRRDSKDKEVKLISMKKLLTTLLTFLTLTLSAQNDTWLNLQIQFDDYPEEVDWKLYEVDTVASNNIIVDEGGPYYFAADSSLLNIFIPNLSSNHTYILEVNDDYGDGLSYPYLGYVHLFNDCTDTISYVSGNYGSLFSDTFMISPCNSPPLGCPDT